MDSWYSRFNFDDSQMLMEGEKMKQRKMMLYGVNRQAIIRKSTILDLICLVVILIIIITFALMSLKCSDETSPSDVPDAQLRIWMKGSDFHNCVIDSVRVYISNELVGYLRNKGYGDEWTVEIKVYLKAGQYNIRAESNDKGDGSQVRWIEYITINANQGRAELRLECKL